MAAELLRSAQLGVLLAVALLCVVSAAGDEAGSENGALVLGLPTRHLLQTKQPCPVDFQTMNYTSITSVCNATNPVKALCCSSFTAFACPYARYINDESTNCAATMFSYLNMAGKYEPQLFQICSGDANGLPCPRPPTPSPNPSSATMDRPRRLSFLVIFVFALIVR